MSISEFENPRKDRAKSIRIPKDMTVKLNISSTDKMLLSRYAAEELNLYNSLITNFQSAFCRNPDVILQISDVQIGLFGLLCQYNISVREAKQTNKIDQQILNDVSESAEILFEVAKYRSAVIPETRKNMAIEILRFFRNQADTKKQQVANSVYQEYKNSFRTVGTFSSNQKYHLQLNRKSCTITYDAELSKSTVWIPHFKKPIISIDDVDLSSSLWNLVIIRPLGQDWYADFKSVGYNYLIKYMDKKSIK